MKYVLIICAFLAVWGLFNQYRVNYAQSQIDALQSEKIEAINKFKECKNEKKAYIKAKERAEKTIGEIRTIVKTVKSPCDCYNSVVDDSIINRVRGNGKN